MRIELTPAPSCGACTLCCKVMGIKVDEPAFEKPKDAWCPHAGKSTGCGIYETRPAPCRTFKCLWLEVGSFRDDLRPDKIHGLLTRTTDGKNLVIHEDPGFVGHARQALRELIDEHLSKDPEHFVIIVCGTRRTFRGNTATFRRLVDQGVITP